MSKYFTLLVATILIASCTLNRKEIVVVDELDVFETAAENQQLGKDLINYNYTEKLKEAFPDVDIITLESVRYSYFVSSNSEKVTFRLTLMNEAIKMQKELTEFFGDFVSEKVNEYEEKQELIAQAQEEAHNYFEWMRSGSIDSIWNRSSSKLRSIAPKDDFATTIQTRNEELPESNSRRVNNRLLYDDLGKGFQGEFIILNYELSSGWGEQITFEQQNDSLLLAGYRYFRVN